MQDNKAFLSKQTIIIVRFEGYFNQEVANGCFDLNKIKKMETR